MTSADFYTDMGEDFDLVSDTGEVETIGRYGIWKNGEVIEDCSTLEEVHAKYGDLPRREIFFIPMPAGPIAEA